MFHVPLIEVVYPSSDTLSSLSLNVKVCNLLRTLLSDGPLTVLHTLGTGRTAVLSCHGIDLANVFLDQLLSDVPVPLPSDKPNTDVFVDTGTELNEFFNQ